jgi:hypothetical protein
VRLNCAGVRFGSDLDEKHLFTWAEEIPSFDHWDRDTLVLRSQDVPEADLRELLALFWRYQIPMRQLTQFETEANRHWFSSLSAYWHEHVFETDSASSKQE